MGLPGPPGSLDQRVGAQVRPGVSRGGLGHVADPGRPPRGPRIPRQLPGWRDADVRAQLLPARRAGRRPVLQLPQARPPGLPARAAGLPGRRAPPVRRDRQDGPVRAAVGGAGPAGVRVQAARRHHRLLGGRPFGTAADTWLAGAGVYLPRGHDGHRGHADRGQERLQHGPGQPAAQRCTPACAVPGASPADAAAAGDPKQAPVLQALKQDGRRELTMTVLRSYVSGAWTAPADEGRPVLDAVTGEEVARVSSAGIDLGAALAYGRSAGGPALRELTFHQRAALLKSLGMLLREHRQELYALSARTGATLGDSKFDVDGGIGVLLSYASKARRELPNDAILAEGAVEPLGKGGTFVGQHILTPLHGVAVQINAFNFPVWGPLEKFAPAFIAGVPSLVKPATQTAYLTARLVELIVDSGLLPEGSVQLVCGSVGGLFDHLAEQDLVSFTGSAATARQLRAHPAIVGRSIRFNAEADSLNCSALGPEAGPGTPEFDLYVRQLVTEMTVKAGQKCTAIRRALVPAALAEQVAEAARDRLAKVVVGNPAEEGVRMGALAGLEQREEVRRSVKALLSAGRIVSGDPDHVDVVGASAERGAFMGPLLLQADDPDRPEPIR